MKRFLCYFELHVGFKTFYLHVIVKARNASKALAQLDKHATDKTLDKSRKTTHYRLQVKGCLGEATKKNLDKYLSLNEIL